MKHPEAQDALHVENPFERWDIDPLGGPAAITERMRALAEEAPSEEARAEIRAAWEELTLHPARRLRAALRAHQGGSVELGVAPAGPAALRSSALPPLDLVDLALRPSILDALGTKDEPVLL